MKGFVKAIIAGAVILGIGVAVLIIALGLNGWTFAPNFTTEEFTSAEENTSLDIHLDAGRLKIEYHDEENIVISYPVANGFLTEINEENGTLSFEGNVKHWYTFSCNVTFPETVIKIPGNTIKNVDITLNAGTVDLPDNTFENLKIKVNAGTCTVGDISGAKIVDIGLNAGTVNIGGASTEKLICEVNAGSANVRKIDCPLTNVKVSAGSASVEFTGAKTDYTAAVDVSTGSCNGLSSQTGGNKQINVKVSAGSCNVSFTG